MAGLKPEHIVSERLKSPCRHVWDDDIANDPQCVSCGVHYGVVKEGQKKEKPNGK